MPGWLGFGAVIPFIGPVDVVVVVVFCAGIEEQEREIILIAFLCYLFFVPMVGEIRSGISFLETVGQTIALIDEAGNVALDIYDVANDEDNALPAICC
ncbi:hypothetical protein PENARI_c010G03669 [Penicillium arizonense]|uniref:Uncharacterized protein n=1 Tax=Penicillium arizonense TaxID=1835702 RepID=A0A1F5LHF6_PENAI|nr:hypothetical protein PENARI_c010G03669 [Penicillium arizonense]OGE52450.1 hypothetical protein PENARI_c010G03669 [Penicillium arizonense]